MDLFFNEMRSLFRFFLNHPSALSCICSTTLSVDELLAMGGEDTEVVLTHHIRSSTLTVGGKAV